jgi:hypothetical protein
MIGDISLLDSYVSFIGRHHGRRRPKEPIILVVVPFAVSINASFTYSELNITIPGDSLDIVARVPAENPIRAIAGFKVAAPPAVIKVISAVALLQAMNLIGPVTPASVKETERCDFR